MIKFVVHKSLVDFVAPVRLKLQDKMFVEASERITGFDTRYTWHEELMPEYVTGKMILDPLISSETETLRVWFYTQNFFAHKINPVNGYVDNTGRNMLLNTRQLMRDPKAIERTIWHELVHVSDSINKKAVYWHGDNNLKGKENTAPVKFAKWATEWRL